MAGNDFLFAGKNVPSKGPCFNCPDREVGCHGKCEVYIAWSAHKAEERDRIHEIKQKRLDSANYIRDITNRYNKRK